MSGSLTFQKKILLVADNSSSSSALIKVLNKQGFRITFGTGSQNLQLLFENDAPDLVILDETLSDTWALEKSKDIRSNFPGPIVILSNNHTDMHHIQSLFNGADDFIAKPFNPILLLARLSTLLARFDRENRDKKNQLLFDGLTVDLSRRDVIIKGKRILLTSIEFDIFSYLAKNAGRVVSRNDVHLTLYNSEHNGYDRSIDIYISRIRQKIDDNLEEPRYLKTVRGAGYLFMGAQKDE